MVLGRGVVMSCQVFPPSRLVSIQVSQPPMAQADDSIAIEAVPSELNERFTPGACPPVPTAPRCDHEEPLVFPIRTSSLGKPLLPEMKELSTATGRPRRVARDTIG